MIKTVLKNNLKKRKPNKGYVNFRLLKKREGNDLHHFLDSFIGGTKQNDYLLAEIDAEFHRRVHYKKQTITEIDEMKMLLNCLEGLFDYVEFLEEALAKNENAVGGLLKK